MLNSDMTVKDNIQLGLEDLCLEVYQLSSNWLLLEVNMMKTLKVNNSLSKKEHFDF